MSKDKLKNNTCKVCEGRTMFHKIGVIYSINDNNEFVIDQKGLQSNIPINYCLNCGRDLND